MYNKMKKICCFLIIIFIILMVDHAVFAAESDTDYSDGASLLDKMEGDASSFIAAGQKAASEADIDAGDIAGNFQGLGQILTMIGAGVMVAVTTYMGIKYLTAGPEAQAKLKVQLIGVVVSGMVIFGAFYIWQLVINVASSL